jgi:hypothetical protein
VLVLPFCCSRKQQKGRKREIRFWALWLRSRHAQILLLLLLLLLLLPYLEEELLPPN